MRQGIFRFAAIAILATAACAPVASPQRTATDRIAIAQQVIAAERAFAERAQREGQWTAFRGTAAPDAVMFVPQRVNAQQWLSGRADPPQSVRWQPHRVAVSCDGTLAATTGSAQWPDGTAGWFTTIWQRQANGEWRWIADHGGTGTEPWFVPEIPIVEVAECPGAEGPEPQPMPAAGEARGASRDHTLLWDWVDGRGLRVTMWIGPHYAPTILPGPPR